ncbi:hypothetical protein [Humidisolicoccus flavus]|uniref:hypothetical protein n=1 Tax=Humidisolicoccus flavus TaxID=3111414 RepID=UPI0032515EDE
MRVDARGFLAKKDEELARIIDLIERTLGRAGQFSCFGMHEWAMVYRDAEHRHTVPLRLGQRGTDEVVDSHKLQCSHFDAFRFFTPAATPKNTEQLTRESQAGREQPGCLHANMDLYKWALKLGPLIPGELLLDCFELAREIRIVDMRASPYDVADWDTPAITVETSEGKAEYVAHQRSFAARGNELRRRLIGVYSAARAELDEALSSTTR